MPARASICSHDGDLPARGDGRRGRRSSFGRPRFARREGDDGFLTKIEARYHKFNYMGDVTRVRGQVNDKFERDGKAYVACGVECVNHRDEVTATAKAEAELPRR